MANRIEFAVSATAVKSTSFGLDYLSGSDFADTADTTHSLDYIEPNIGKTLGGSGSISGIAATVVGYGNPTDGVANYSSLQIIIASNKALMVPLWSLMICRTWPIVPTRNKSFALGSSTSGSS